MALTYQNPIKINNKINVEVFDVSEIPNVACVVYMEYNNRIKRIVGKLPTSIECLTIWWNEMLEEVSIQCEKDSKLNRITISRNPSLTQINIQPPDTVIAINYSMNKITKLPVLPPNLIVLNCSHNPIRFLPTLPETIRNLDFGHTNIDEFPQLPKHLHEMFLVWWRTSIKPENCWGKQLQTSYEKWQRENLEATKARHKKRIQTIKEDLMIKTWHTDRFLYWCLDKEEQEDFGF